MCSLYRTEKSRLIDACDLKSPEEEEAAAADLMLLLSKKIAQRDIGSGSVASTNTKGTDG